MKTFAVKVTAAKLAELRMLADWQLRALGFDPASVTAACQAADSPQDWQPAKWNTSRNQRWNDALSQL